MPIKPKKRMPLTEREKNEAYGTVIKPNLRLITSIAKSHARTRPGTDAKDVSQDIILELLRSFGTVNPQKNIGGLVRVIANRAGSKLSRQRRVSGSFELLDRNLHGARYRVMGIRQQIPDEIVSRREELKIQRRRIQARVGLLIRTVASLSPKKRESISRKYGLPPFARPQSLAEISRAMKSNPGTVGVWIHRAKVDLKRIMG